MVKMSIELSIIVPVYNVEKYLNECIDSIRNQTFSNFECLLINDGSTDSSGSICDEVSKIDNRFKVFHIKNGGVSNARNVGISNAIGKFITFIDSDDFIENNAYQKIFDIINKTNSDICCFNFYTYDEIKGINKIPFNNKDLITNYIKFPINMNSLCNKVIRASIFKENNYLFDTDIIVSEDMLLSFKLLNSTDKIVFIDDYFYYYRYNLNSATKSKMTQRKIDDTYKSYEKVSDFCKEKNISKSSRKLLRYLNANAVRPYLVVKEYFNPSKFRSLVLKNNVWTYSFRPDLFFIYLFALLHLDFLCRVAISVKGL